MNTKLTLTIQKEVIDLAKTYAREKGQSLSEMIENYLKLVTVSKAKVDNKKLSSNVRKLKGVIKTDSDLDYEQILSEELSKKYGL